MKIQTLTRINKEDFKGDLPGWFDSLLQLLNDFLFPVGKALNRGLDFPNNFYGLETVQTLTHNVAKAINPSPGVSVRPRVKGVLVIDADGEIVTGCGFVRNNDGSISVTVLYSAAGTTSAQCTLQIQYG